jgi:hypothetical protein
MHRHTMVLDKRLQDEKIYLKLRLSPAKLGKLTQSFPQVQTR